jgi:hypothetical protein
MDRPSALHDESVSIWPDALSRKLLDAVEENV